MCGFKMTAIGIMLTMAIFWQGGCNKTNPSEDSSTQRNQAFDATRFTVQLDDHYFVQDSWWYASFTPDGKRIVALGGIYDTRTGQLLARIAGGNMDARIFAISPDGKTVAVVDEGFRGTGNTEYWQGVSFANIDTGKIERTIEVPDIAMLKIYFPTPSRVAVLSVGNLHVMDVDKGKIVKTFGGVDYRDTAVSPDGKHYAQVHTIFPNKDGLYEQKARPESLNYSVSIHDLESGKELAKLPETQGIAERLDWTPDGHHIIVQLRGRLAVIDVSGESMTTREFRGWIPTTPLRMVMDRYMLLGDEKNEKNAFLDLATCKMIPIDIPDGCKIVAISPDGKRAVVHKYVPSDKPANTMYLATIVDDYQPLPTSIPASQLSSQLANELTLDLGGNVTMKLVFIPAGRFLMGRYLLEYVFLSRRMSINS